MTRLTPHHSCTVEVAGNVFFGSSLGLLHRVLDELGITMQQDETRVQTTPAFRSSHNSPFQVMKDRRSKVRQDTQKPSSSMRSPPKYLVLDLSRLHNLDGKLVLLARLEIPSQS